MICSTWGEEEEWEGEKQEEEDEGEEDEEEEGGRPTWSRSCLTLSWSSDSFSFCATFA